MKISKDEIRYRIIKKLARHKIFGAKHTSIDNLPKGMPQELHKEVINEAKEMIKEGVLMQKPNSYGLEVSLNPRMTEYVKKTIGDRQAK